MDGRAHLRTKNGWLKFDQLALTLAGLAVLTLALLSHLGYGPNAYKSCPDKSLETQAEDIKADLPKVVVAPTPPVPAPAPAPATKPEPVPEPMIEPVGKSAGPITPASVVVKLPPVPPFSSVRAAKTGQQVSLSGVVPSAQAKSKLVADAQRALVEGVVIDRLIVETAARPAVWLDKGNDVVKLLQSIRQRPAVDVSGDSVRLTGTVTGSTDREVAGLKAVEIFGPDSKLHNLIEVKPLQDALVEFETRGKHAILAGYVNSEATYNTLMQNAYAVFGNENVTDRLAVDENTSDISWQPASSAVVKALSVFNEPSGVRLKGEVAVLTGIAGTENEKSNRGVTMHNLLGPSIKIDNQIVVRQLLPSLVDFENADGKLTLSGQVGSDTIRLSLLEAAESVFGVTYVTDRLSVTEGIAPISWSTNIGRVTEQVFSLKMPGGLRVSGDNITLTGTVSFVGEREERAAQAQALFGTSAKIDNQIRVLEPIAGPAPVPEQTLIPEPVTPPQPEPQVSEVPPPVTVVDCKRISTGTLVGFATNKAELTFEGRSALDDVSVCLKDGRYQVAGHTDSTGNRVWNDELSLLRAKAAAAYLVSIGIDKSRLEAKGLGSSQPVGSNASPEGRAKNRRITFTAKP